MKMKFSILISNLILLYLNFYDDINTLEPFYMLCG